MQKFHIFINFQKPNFANIVLISVYSIIYNTVTTAKFTVSDENDKIRMVSWK